MASAFVSSASFALDEALGSQAWPVMMSGGEVQVQGPTAENVPEKAAKTCRQPTWSSSMSTAVGDTESETSVSPRSACSVMGRVVSLSFCPEGCRQVQDALVEASDSAREHLASELHGHAFRAVRCPHANHVLQKCISIVPPTSLQFIVDELLEQEGRVRKVAMNRYGSRIIQQLLRKCGASQVRGLAEAVLQDAFELSRHTFGNFAVTHLLEFGTAQQKYGLVRTIERNMGTIARGASGGGVLLAALKHAATEDLVWTARAAVQDPSLLLDLAHGRRGHESVLITLSVLPELERARACRGLMESMAELRATRYGKKVAAYLEMAGY